MSSSQYGLGGFVLSSIYLSARIADIGNAYGIVALLKDITESKKSHDNILIKYFFAPQIPFILIFCLILGIYIPIDLRGLATSVFVLETYRLFLRYYLHTKFESKIVVTVELWSFLLFLVIVWGTYITSGILSPKVILTAHLFDSFCAVACLGTITLRHAWRLTRISPFAQKKKIVNCSYLVKNKVLPYLNRLTREVTSTNVLTPVYGMLFGYEKVSVFYFLGIATMAYQMIIKNTITYSGNALFAQLRYASTAEKNYAFYLIFEKLTLMTLIPLATIAVFYHDCIRFFDQTIIDLILGFLTLMSLDLIMHIYEQYYAIQDKPIKFFFFKSIEALSCLGIFYFGPTWSITDAFLAFIIIKIVTMMCVILQTYAAWGAFPRLYKISIALALTIGGSLIAKIIFYLIVMK